MKQVIVLRSDLSMSEGKLVAQGCHASLGAFQRASEKNVKEWLSSGGKKVVLKVESLSELMSVKERARSQSIPFFLVRDAGHTEVEPGTITALGLGPVSDELIDSVTGELHLL